MEAVKLIRQLNSISKRKLDLLQEIEACTFKQGECIKSGKLDEVEKIIEEKQKLMNKIDKLDSEFAVYAGELKKILNISSFESLPDFNMAGTKELKEVVEKIYAVLGRIKKMDGENTALVKKELSQTGDRITHTNTFKKVSKAYGPSKPVNPSYFFDKKN